MTAVVLAGWGLGVVLAFFAATRLRRRAPRAAFVLRRAAWVVVTVVATFTAAFVLMRLVPGGPFDTEVAMDPAIRARLMTHYGLDRPAPVVWADTLAHVLSGDLGPSLRMRDFTVNELLAQGLPASAVLGSVALALALLLGIPAGALAATRRGRLGDRALMTVAALGLALPTFVIAAALVVVFSFELRILPPAGFGAPRHLVLPAAALAAPTAAAIARLVRSGLVEQLGRDHVRTARAKGLSPARVLFVHALPPALIPVVAYVGPAAAAVLTGSLVVESIFAIPGCGSFFVHAAMNRDYPLAMGAVLLYTVVVATLNVVVDALASVLDPRVELA